MKNFLIALIIILGVIFIGSPRSASAGDRWCPFDPVITVDGQRIKIIAVVNQTAAAHLTSVNYTIALPPGSHVGTVTTDSPKEHVSFVYRDWLQKAEAKVVVYGKTDNGVSYRMQVSWQAIDGGPYSKEAVTQAGYTNQVTVLLVQKH